jgi:hypothetical protein
VKTAVVVALAAAIVAAAVVAEVGEDQDRLTGMTLQKDTLLQACSSSLYCEQEFRT